MVYTAYTLDDTNKYSSAVRYNRNVFLISRIVYQIGKKILKEL